MQTLERAIIEPEGWYFIETKLTAAGKKKILDLFCYVFDNQAPYSIDSAIDDIESESTNGLMHPVLKFRDYYEELIEGVDYVLEFQSKEAFELALLAKQLNDMHETMQQEMERLGW